MDETRRDETSQAGGVAFRERLFARYLDSQPLMNKAASVRGSVIWVRFPRIFRLAAAPSWRWKMLSNWRAA